MFLFKKVLNVQKLLSNIQSKSFTRIVGQFLTKREIKCDPCAKKPKKKKIFSNFFNKNGKKRQKLIEKAAKECREEHKADCDPDLSKFGDDKHIFRTEGVAFILLKGKPPPIFETPVSKEDKILHKIQAPIDEKHFPDITMPPFVSVEQRMIDLNSKRLHPLFKKYMRNPPKRLTDFIKCCKGPEYTFRQGPINIENIPIVFSFNEKILGEKNIFYGYKRAHKPCNPMKKPFHLTERKMAKEIEVIQLQWKHYQIKKKPSQTLYQKDTLYY